MENKNIRINLDTNLAIVAGAIFNRIIPDLEHLCNAALNKDYFLTIPSSTIEIAEDKRSITDPNYDPCLASWNPPDTVLIKLSLLDQPLSLKKVLLHELMHALGDVPNDGVFNESNYVRNEYWAERRTLIYGDGDIQRANEDSLSKGQSFILKALLTGKHRKWVNVGII